MQKLKTIQVTNGVYWVEAPQARLSILCGCPADSVKYLMKLGLIVPVERDNVSFETGPNAILLSDVLVQNEQFSNLSEFPVLQMLYRQGLIIPGHPNNTGMKPLLMGSKEQVYAQQQYIYRGNYGLVTVEELMEAGLSEEEAHEHMRLKLKFAFGNIRRTDELLDSLVVDKKFTEIRNGVKIRRRELNVYEFQYKGESVVVDLNLKPEERYEAPYELGFHEVNREYFAIVHSGEGNGWDIYRPCMASILMYQGRNYLIDAGPNISKSLLSLGFDASEIEAIFHTHGHDDHFAGLPALMTSDRRIKYYATPLVRASVTKKLSALMAISEDKFSQYFEIHDLEYNVWNDINGLEVKPIFSPHPVETSIFIFRTFWKNRYYTYAHFADIASFDVLKKMITEEPSAAGISPELYEKVYSDYLTPVDLKKIDIGGGLIHGKALDFAKDPSKKIILAHTALELTNQEKAIGSNANFGSIDVLIPANRDYLRKYAKEFLNKYFKTVPAEEKDGLLNCPTILFNAGTILLKEGELDEYAYLILSGTVEFVRIEDDQYFMLSTGSIIGDIDILNERPSTGTYRAASYVQAIQFPKGLYRYFVNKHGLYDEINRIQINRAFLQNTTVFGNGVSYPVQEQIAKLITLKSFEADQIVLELGTIGKGLFILMEGELISSYNGKMVETLKSGDVFGEESFVFGIPNYFEIKATQPSEVCIITDTTPLDIPLIHWRLSALYAKRMSKFGAHILSSDLDSLKWEEK